MQSLLETKGELTVSLGEGYLSLYEACTLRPGHVVRSRHLAGASHALVYNGAPLAQCEVVILGREGGGSVWGVRVSDTDFPSTFAFGPCRKDDVGELVPFMIRLGSIRVSLRELAGVARNTLISLGIPWSAEVDADLVAGGVAVARGKVVAIDEEMGLRVTETVSAPCETAIVGSSGYLLDQTGQDGRTIKDYDFRRPDKVTRNLIDRVRDIHALFLRNLRARVPALSVVLGDLPWPAVVDQCTLEEAMTALAARGLHERIVVENRSSRRPPIAELGGVPVRPVLQEEGTSHPVDSGLLARLSREIEESHQAGCDLLFVVHGGALTGAEPEREAFLASLRDAWRNYVDLNLASPSIASGEDVGLSENEMVVLVSFGPTYEEHVFSLIYPYLTLEPYVRVLSA